MTGLEVTLARQGSDFTESSWGRLFGNKDMRCKVDANVASLRR